MKEVFESVEKKSEIDIPDLEKRMPEKRVCIIFHGAPFTGIWWTLTKLFLNFTTFSIFYTVSEYQETACRSAKVLGIPVLDIDKGITEIIAFNKSTCAIQLRQIIDEIYQKYIEAFEKWKYDPESILLISKFKIDRIRNAKYSYLFLLFLSLVLSNVEYNNILRIC